MKQIRKSVFETNSSSTHSVTIKDGPLDYVNEEDKIEVYPGEFGWEEERYTTFPKKLSYAYTHAMHWGSSSDLIRLNNVLKKHFNRTIIYKDLNSNVYDYETLLELKENGDHIHSKFGFIDHQSTDVSECIFTSDYTLEQFLFNTNSYFTTDNDNH